MCGVSMTSAAKPLPISCAWKTTIRDKRKAYSSAIPWTTPNIERSGRDDISAVEELLVEVLREGKLVYALPSLEEMRSQRESDLSRLDPGILRLINPHIYHVSLTQELWELKQRLIEEAVKAES